MTTKRDEFVKLLKEARDLAEQHWQPGRYKDDAFARVLAAYDAASQPVAGEAVAWLIPSSSGREPNDRGFIDAMAWSDGEFTMPVYTHPAPKPAPAAPDGWVCVPREQIRDLEAFRDGAMNALNSDGAKISEQKKWIDRLETIVERLVNHCDKDGGECQECGRICCPHGEPLHFHHDGCPACSQDDAAMSGRGA